MSNHCMTWEEAVRYCMQEPSMASLARAAYFLPPLEAGEQYWRSAEFAEVKRNLPPLPGRALDLGAGNGILSYALAKEGWEVTAVEPDPSDLIGAGAIRVLASALPSNVSGSIAVIEAFGEAIPLDSAGFDVIVARQVLHHAADISAFCCEMARLSRNGGLILTLRDHVISGPEQLEAFLDRHPLHRFYGGENAFTRTQYRAALNGAGLNILAEWRGFQSIINFDPHTQNDIRRMVSARFGVLRPIAAIVMKLVPFFALGFVLAVIDRSPGRLISFLAVKAR